MPSPRPRVPPSSPRTSASTSTEPVTWRRLAPRARSSASSRERWATRIEKVLTMRKAPTTRATPAKTSRKVSRKPIASCRSAALDSAASSPVTASRSPPSTSRTCSASSSWLTPSAAVTHTSVQASCPPRKSSCAVAASKAARVAPLSDPPSAKSARPTSVGSTRACSPGVWIGTVSPTAYPARSAVRVSSTTSWGPWGARPSTITRPSRPSTAGASLHPWPRAGGPKPPTGRSSASMT